MDEPGRWWPAGVSWLAALVLSVPLYAAETALQHFAWHLGYGAAAGLLVAAGWVRWRGSPGPGWPWWTLGGYAYMVVPDVLWLAPTLVGRPPYGHEPWMDVFLGHVTLDHWFLASVVVLPVLGAAAALYAWSRAKHT